MRSNEAFDWQRGAQWQDLLGDRVFEMTVPLAWSYVSEAGTADATMLTGCNLVVIYSVVKGECYAVLHTIPFSTF
jgi:hypothetical protein